MAPRRKPPQNVGELDFSKKLADALGQSKTPEPSVGDRAPIAGEQVKVGNRDTVWTILSISYSGKEVNLHIPGTALQRFRVMVADLVYIENPLPPKPKEPEKPKIDVEAAREHIKDAQHSILEHLHSEIAALKKSLRKARVTADDPLDEFVEATESSWQAAVEAIGEKLDE